MFKKLKQKIYKIIRGDIYKMELDLLSLRAQVAYYRNLVGDPKEVVKRIFNKDLTWFDSEEMKLEERVEYYREAQYILNSKVFNNELNKLKTLGMQESLISTKEFSQIRDWQMTLNGYELIKTVLEEIPDPTRQTESKENIYSGI